MRIALILALGFILGLDCARPVLSQTEKHENVNRNLPIGFRGIDFKNLRYPGGQGRRRIRLRNGKDEHAYHKGLGGEIFEFEDVHYVDLNGDGKKDAIVQLFQLICGGSCDGGSHLFYVYSIRQGRLSLLSRLETGSLAYECGLKSFVLEKQKLTLELFRRCRTKGSSFQPASQGDEGEGKFTARFFTRFILQFDGQSFVLKKRSVLPNPQEDVKNYSPRVTIK